MIFIRTLDTFFQIINIALIARAILSWVSMTGESNQISSFVYRFTEPILKPMRTIFEKYELNRGMIDFSFIATFIAIDAIHILLRNFFVRFLV